MIHLFQKDHKTHRTFSKRCKYCSKIYDKVSSETKAGNFNAGEFNVYDPSDWSMLVEFYNSL